MPELRLVSKYGVGLDMIDLAAARRHGVSVRWTPGVNRQAVAELTIGFMIALGRSLVPLAHEMGDGGWRHPGGRQLSSALVGIVGCGHVGQRVARLSVAFGARVVAYDIRAYDDFYRETGVNARLVRRAPRALGHRHDSRAPRCDDARLDRFGRAWPDEVLRVSHQHQRAAESLTKQALKAALLERRLAGAALDVFASEPPADPELLRLPNFVGTPHIGGNTEEAVLAMGRAAIAGLDDPGRQIDDSSLQTAKILNPHA